MKSPQILAVTFALLTSAVITADEALPIGARGRIGTAHWRVPLNSRGAAMSQDGKTIIIERLNGGGILQIDSATGRVMEPPFIELNLHAHAFPLSRDGRTLAICGHNSILVWDMTAMKPLRNITRDQGSVHGYFLADGGTHVAIALKTFVDGKAGSKVAVWDLATGKVVASVTPLHNDTVRAAVSPDGKLLVTFGAYRNDVGGANAAGMDPNSVVQVWDVGTGQQKSRIATGTGYVSAVRFAPDCKTIATAGRDVPIQLWNAADGKSVRQFAAQAGQGERLWFSPDGAQLIATGADGSIQIWDTGTGSRVGICEAVCPRVFDIAFPPDGPAVALGIVNCRVVRWTIPDGKLLAPDDGLELPPAALGFSSDGKKLRSFEADGRLREWDAATLASSGASAMAEKEDRRDRARGQVVFPVADFAPNARWLLAAKPNGGGRYLFDSKSGTQLCALSPIGLNSWPAHRASFSTNSAFVAVVLQTRNAAGNADDGAVHVWKAETGEHLAGWPVPWIKMNFDPCAVCSVSSDGTRLVVASLTSRDDSGQHVAVGTFDANTGRVLHQARFPSPFPPFPPIIATDNRSVLMMGRGGGAVLWDLVTGTVLREDQLNRSVATVPPCLSKTGRFVALVVYEPSDDTSRRQGHFGLEHAIVVLEWASGEKRLQFPIPNRADVVSLALSPDGRTLAAGCSDTSILLYDLAPTRVAGSSKASPDELWRRLATSSAADAWVSIRELHARPDVSIGLLRERLRPTAPKPRPDAAAVLKWLAQLDAKAYTEREEAERQLISHGAFVAKEVQTALEKATSQEAKRRLERITIALNKPVVISVADARGLELLELLGTTEAFEYVRKLAAGDSAAALTRDAQMTLGRMTPIAAK